MALLLFSGLASEAYAGAGRARQQLRVPKVFRDEGAEPTGRYARPVVTQGSLVGLVGPPILPRLTRVSMGHITEPVKVVDDPGGGRPLRVLLHGSNVKLLASIAAERFVEVTTGPTTVFAGPAPSGPLSSDRTPGARLGPGLSVVRVPGATAGQRVPITYTDDEVEVTGYVNAHALGRSYLSGRLFNDWPLEHGELADESEIRSAPGGSRLAFLPKGRLVQLLGPKRGDHLLIRWWGAQRQVMVTGWVAQEAVTRLDKPYSSYGRGDGGLGGRGFLSIPGLPGYGLTCVSLKKNALFRDQPAGEIVGVVTTDGEFLLLERRERWLSIGIGHPWGFARVWVADDPKHPLAASVEHGSPTADEPSDITAEEREVLIQDLLPAPEPQP